MKKLFIIFSLFVSSLAHAQIYESIWPEADGTPMTISGLNQVDLIAGATTQVTFSPTVTTTTTGGVSNTWYWAQRTANYGVIYTGGVEIKNLSINWNGGWKKGYYIYRLYAKEAASPFNVYWKNVTIVVSKNSGTYAANAGNDSTTWKNQTKHLGEEKFELNGQFSKGASSYKWRQISGSPSLTITNDAAATTLVSGSIIEDVNYKFELTINEGTGNEKRDTVTKNLRDAMKLYQSPCRAGGGWKYIVPPTSSGTNNGVTWNRFGILFLRQWVTDQVTQRVMPDGSITIDNTITLQGGDTLLFQGVDSTAYFQVGAAGGSEGCPIVLQPYQRPVNVKGNTGYYRFGTASNFEQDTTVLSYLVLDGTSLRGNGYYYGWQTDNGNAINQYSIMDAQAGKARSAVYNRRDSFAATFGDPSLSASAVHHFEVKGFYANGTGSFHIQHYSNPYGRFMHDKFVNRNIYVHDAVLKNSNVEGIYIGPTNADGTKSTAVFLPPIRLDSVRIEDVITDSTDWDGIQLASCERSGNYVKNCIVLNAGLDSNSVQSDGILAPGGNGMADVDSNFVWRAYGKGLSNFGYGLNHFRNNVVYWTTGYSLYDRSTPTYPDLQPTDLPLQESVIDGNVFVKWEDFTPINQSSGTPTPLAGSITNNIFFTTKDGATVSSLISSGISPTISGNTVQGTFPISDAHLTIDQATGATVSITQAGETQTFINDPQAATNWLLGRAKGTTETPPANVPPVANAGADITISEPLTTTILNGSGTDADGAIVSYSWIQLIDDSDPNAHAASISTPLAANTNIRNLLPGDYDFELTVTDDAGATAKDTVHVTVLANLVPVVNAGIDQLLVLPTNSTTLSGSVTDDGTVTYQWAMVIGSGATITTPTAATTTVTGLSEGVYLFRLTATDNNGVAASDDVIVTVNNKVYKRQLQFKKL